MDFSEFQRRLGAEPRSRAPDLQAARAQGPEYAALAREAEAFEDRLEASLRIAVDEATLLGDLLQAAPRQRRTRWFTLAASLLLTAGVAGVLWSVSRPAPTLPEYLADHYAHDGAELLARVGQAVPDDIARVLARFEVSATPALAERVGYIKICPSMHGKGAHMVVQSEAGWVTVLYLPGVTVEEGRIIPIAGEQARLLAMAGGAAVIIGADALADEHLATLLHETLVPVASDA